MAPTMTLAMTASVQSVAENAVSTGDWDKVLLADEIVHFRRPGEVDNGFDQSFRRRFGDKVKVPQGGIGAIRHVHGRGRNIPKGKQADRCAGFDVVFGRPDRNVTDCPRITGDNLDPLLIIADDDIGLDLGILQ